MFWSDPAAATPGLCWNAGVTCSPGPAAALRCEPDNYDLSGAAGVAAGHTREVMVPGLTGVPTSYAGGELEYSTSCSADALARDGICPGCSAGGREAAPPVRVRALAERLPAGDVALASMCGEPQRLWGSLTSDLLEQVRPACSDEGSRAEVVVIRTAPPPDATCLTVLCRESASACAR